MQTSHVKVELRDDVLQRVIGELELKRPPKFRLHDTGSAITTTAGKGVQYRGYYSSKDNLVVISNGFQAYSRERMPELVRHLTETVLHELRHAWQRENWTAEELAENSSGPYELRIEEQDANAWAEYARPKFPGLVRVTRRPVGGKSHFARFSEKHPTRRG